ncbi:hypothetical protein M8C21_016550 [Ambrosia artemisiifolia]|uniref:diacylglycerol O-acyltransferase n=1 Tax=Ambrosia artemisiifolia TaxID=4212 RepID=A0AAD5G5S5_AMBAR|nr:hypothetical protein M8C21_016550 [Ambrosia artemisiifolia]
MDTQSNEPLTPAGRLFVQPATELIINCALGIDCPVAVETARWVISGSLLVKHPRFTSLLVTDKHGREHWRRVEIEVDRHIILVPDPVSDEDVEDEVAVNDYLANLTVSCPLTTDKPLWEIHILNAHKCVVMRFHHALGDGVSLLSLLLTMCRRVSDGEKIQIVEPKSSSVRNNGGVINKVWMVLKMLWLTLVYMLEFCMRCLCVRDKETVVRGGPGVELWPRKMATAKFKLDDMKTVKGAVVNATINDVLFGVISSGLSRYLENHSTKPLRDGVQITGAAMVNLRKSAGLQETTELMNKKSGSRWGNKFGKADMQILVAKDIIPHPEILAKYFEDALLEMKEAALAAKVPAKSPQNSG